MTDSTSPAPVRQAALAFIFITVALDMLAVGMIVPILPKLVVSFLNGDTVRSAEIYGLFGTVWALMQFGASPVLGALSDRFGRRPVILVSNFGLGLDYVLMALAPSLAWLFVGRILSGITAASISTAGAYIADVTPPEKRAASFGMLGAAFGLGFVLGPALGGMLGATDPRLPFWIAAGLSLLNGMYGLFVLPESLPRERRAAFSWRRANPLGSLKLLRSNRDLFGLATVTFLSHLSHGVLISVYVLYVGYRYGWDERTVGLTLAGSGIASTVVQAGLVRPIVARLGERRTLLLGLGFGVVGFALYGLATTGVGFWMAIPVMALWGLAGPAAQGLMTRRVGASEQGQLQGANSSLMGISSLIGPILFTQTFAWSINPDTGWHLPGAPFLLAAVLLACAALQAWRVTRPVEQEAEVIPPPAPTM
ncbi:TCR/Tet family MFS transporter [Hyalangium rubrum]|uniref:TCR/Tet family MFS transporter n=1 Tax=Hyalangium rubrum TaxID=3103134 RepID=A0ABU5HHC9_9BACT|nr:TCR/Tet family MFS transporter [Hyalangium sp. s54d21]MDY7232863.1 TCR/Tet family MFS transporter [Hyalangium sp. s54d21]